MYFNEQIYLFEILCYFVMLLIVCACAGIEVMNKTCH